MPDTWDSLTAEQKAERVAKEVMGWEPCAGNKLYWRTPSPVQMSDYRPTENIAQAMEVAEFMYRERHLSVEIAFFYSAATRRARFWDNEQSWHAFSAKTAEAICHAAVLAVKGEQP